MYIVVRNNYKLYATNEYKIFVEYCKAANRRCCKNNQISVRLVSGLASITVDLGETRRGEAIGVSHMIHVVPKGLNQLAGYNTHTYKTTHVCM